MAHQAGIYIRSPWFWTSGPVPRRFVAWLWSSEIFFFSFLDGMLVHRRVTPQFLICRYPWFLLLGGERHWESKEHNTVTSARAPTQTAGSEIQRTNHSSTRLLCFYTLCSCQPINLNLNCSTSICRCWQAASYESVSWNIFTAAGETQHLGITKWLLLTSQHNLGLKSF